MNVTTTYTIIDCSECNVLFGITGEFEQRRRTDGGTFYCPVGHAQHYRDSTEKRLAREREAHARTIARFDQVRAERDAIERSRSATRGQLTKVKNRVANGVCPCCSRTFSDLARHMTAKHPDYAHVEAVK